MIMAPKSKDNPKYQEGDKVLCYHGPVLYEAKIQKIEHKTKETLYLVHYQGWNKSWDEWVDEERMVKYNDHGLQKQKELREQHSKSSKKASKHNSSLKSTPATPVLNTQPQTPSEPKAVTVATAKPPEKEKETLSTSATPVSEKPSLKHKSSVDAAPDSSRKKKVKVEVVADIEEQPAGKIEVVIKLPESLKPVLVDDWDMINRQKMLVHIPAEKNIESILNEYHQAMLVKDKDCQDIVLEITKGIRDYFNTMLGNQLLYKFERTQYGELIKEHKNKQMTDIYGSVHLLRLFVKIGNMLSYTTLSDKTVSILITHLQDFLKWMSKNQTSLFGPQEYYTATAEYHRKSLG